MFDPGTLIGYIVNGRYRLASLCGTGSYGWVYAADEVAFGEVIGQAAVKLLRPPDDDARKAVIREVQAMRQLTHPNLLRCYGAGEVSDGLARGGLYIATELASETLEARLKRPGRMAPEEVREVAEQIASALAHLCGCGAVHRDVKPANILRVGNVWKLGDFGLVRGFAGTSMQASGRKGTVLYMSPEAMQGETGPFVDVWALGVVVQECLTGSLPYTGASDAEVIAAALTREPTISGDLAEPFATIVRECLTKDRRKRWSAEQVVGFLRGASRSPSVSVSRAPEAAGAAAPVPQPAHSRARAASPGSGRRYTGPRPPAHARQGDIWVNPRDGAELVYVPAGEFTMGSEDGEPDERPQRRVHLDAFWMYRYPVTVAQYRRFCNETRREMPEAPEWGWLDDHPIVKVRWYDAQAYADWAGVSLPTEAQWEKAARGTDGRKWPWGNGFHALKAVCSVGKRSQPSTAPVGSIPSGASPYGCLDMAGNVWEWCADWYDPEYYAQAPNRNPRGPAIGQRRVLRGGSRAECDWELLRASYRNRIPPGKRGDVNGFRCAAGP